MKEKSNTQDNAIFCSFLLLDSEFALPVECVQEVVNFPDRLTPVPLAPPFVMGLFNLRGQIIPLLDLAQILQINQRSALEDERKQRGEQKIAIVESKDAIIGLLFDSTGDVFKEQVGERSHFEETHRPDHDGLVIAERAPDYSVVSGAFRRGEKGSIIQILEVDRLFKLQKVPKESQSKTGGRRWGQSFRGPRHQCIAFRVGPSQCALPIGVIQEIIKLNKIQNSTLASGFCLGIMDLRGTIVPIIDFAALLQYSKKSTVECDGISDQRLIVMKLGEELFGLLVDSVDNIISYYSDELLTFPILEQARGGMFLGCIASAGRSEILLLDHQQILESREIFEITRGHSDLYNATLKSKDKRAAKALKKVGYLTFQIERSCALPLSDVVEIIPYPQGLIRLPRMKDFVQGVVNLRGKLVTLLDGRRLYSEDSRDRSSIDPDSKNLLDRNSEDRKVLIFQKEGTYLGLIVDEVSAIVYFSEEDKIKIPLLSMNTQPEMIVNDISEVVRVSLEKGEKQDLLILDLNRIYSRFHSPAEMVS